MTTPITRIFSGVQPTGKLTLGNYLGAVKRFVELQDGPGEKIYCIVDLHALTVNPDPAELVEGTLDIAATYMACGLDPAKSILFSQSTVPAHAELAWLFDCVARMGWMKRMTQFKDKAGKNSEAASVGLFNYPVLMAADILAYHASHVPVGDDQKQHLELTRDVATKFNNDYGKEFFPIPEPLIEGAATRIMSLRDGTKKMSKSDPSDMSRINLTDSAEDIAKKIKKAKTDPEPLPASMDDLSGRPEARNLVNIYAALSGQAAEQVLQEYEGAQFGAFKPKLADLAVESLAPISARFNDIRADRAEIERALAKGGEAANAIAAPIVAEAKEIMGLLRPKG
ncbi:tryptophan--tRNA ligase [Paracoccaceae bacterium GXU_MW_L88]